GRGVAAVADEVGRYFSPRLATRRNAAGALVRTGIGIGSWPAAPGQAFQHARLVMLTETTRAHGHATVRLAGERGRFVKWNLSSSHPRPDDCDSKARADSGFGPGVYRPSDFPAMPTHPRCRCFSTAMLPEDAG
ncbi:MAG: hypothetical protein M3Q74_00925, partial [Pseudomonadota bacterium]|nr:hypothetical protein [Pseudomonadota bacterium]